MNNVVEFKFKDTLSTNPDWRVLHYSFPITDDFDVYCYRINEIVYTECTAEFMIEFDKIQMWRTLQIKVDL